MRKVLEFVSQEDEAYFGATKAGITSVQLIAGLQKESMEWAEEEDEEGDDGEDDGEDEGEDEGEDGMYRVMPGLDNEEEFGAGLFVAWEAE
ncbi:hypothetical protein I307_04442 [Cryptococcus deuterogattii 99/473]|nr:hypothetical protein I307_04442 [Cryptococcus deuterogattii 99/473]